MTSSYLFLMRGTEICSGDLGSLYLLFGWSLGRPLFAHALLDQLCDVGWQLGDFRAHRFQRGDLLLGCAFAARNDRARVAHALAFGSRLACDKAYNWLGDVLFDIVRRLDLSVATDLTDQHD